MEKEKIFNIVDKWAKETLLTRKAEMCEYLNDTFTQKQRNGHGDNIMEMMPNKGDIALLKIMFLQKFVGG